jgi:hypothetical protein
MSQQWTRFPPFTAARGPLLLGRFLTAMQLPFVRNEPDAAPLQVEKALFAGKLQETERVPPYWRYAQLRTASSIQEAPAVR